MQKYKNFHAIVRKFDYETVVGKLEDLVVILDFLDYVET